MDRTEIETIDKAVAFAAKAGFLEKKDNRSETIPKLAKSKYKLQGVQKSKRHAGKESDHQSQLWLLLQQERKKFQKPYQR